jgi:uncharacterized damage-inducible protein DinB
LKNPFAEMLQYNQWANRTLFEACRPLTDRQLDTHAAGSSTIVRELLTHIATGQQTIVVRAMGGQQPSWGEWPGLDALTELADHTNNELMAIADTLAEDIPVSLERDGKVHRFPMSFLLVQALTHGVEHRTEIKTVLASTGVATPDLDSWSYARAAGFMHEL